MPIFNLLRSIYYDMEEIGICPDCLEHCDFEDDRRRRSGRRYSTKANDQVDEIALREAEEKLHNQ